MEAQAQPNITRNEHDARFELADTPERGQLRYRQDGSQITLIHTEVADELEGEGVGSALIRAALDYAEANELTVVPDCPFVAGWLERHPDRAAELDVAAS